MRFKLQGEVTPFLELSQRGLPWTRKESRIKSEGNTERALRLASRNPGAKAACKTEVGKSARVLTGETSVTKVRSLCTGSPQKDEL